MLSKSALIVTDLHSTPANIKYTEEEKGREGREKSVAKRLQLTRHFAQSLVCCAQAFTRVSSPLQHSFFQVLLWRARLASGTNSYSLFFSNPVKQMIHYTHLWFAGARREPFWRSLVHSTAKRLKSASALQRTHKVKLYGDATGKLNGSGTDRWTKRLGNACWVLLIYSRK